jgi:hypothetical protein
MIQPYQSAGNQKYLGVGPTPFDKDAVYERLQRERSLGINTEEEEKIRDRERQREQRERMGMLHDDLEDKDSDEKWNSADFKPNPPVSSQQTPTGADRYVWWRLIHFIRSFVRSFVCLLC